MTEVRVNEIRKRTWVRNPISGHEWPVYGKVTGWEVYGPLGHISNHKSEEAANKVADEWRAFYLKHPINYGHTND